MADESGKPGLNINAAEFRPNPNAPSFVPGAAWTVPRQNPSFQNEKEPEPEQPPPETVESWDDGLDDEPEPPLASAPETISKHSPSPAACDTDAPQTADAHSQPGHVIDLDSAQETLASPPGGSNGAGRDDPAVPVVNGVDPAGSEDEDEDSDEDVMDEVPPAVRKKALSEQGAPKKESVNVIFIGHVDAGKSTIGGQIMYLTGMVDKRTLEKYEREAKEKNRESWYLSWALDTNVEEREKGKTVEVGRAFFETEKRHFTILDAPGHKSFVPNMIGGASQADLAVLVISARKGEFETGFDRGGQTREHAMLVKTAGVKFLIILVNKMDDPTVQWSEERFIECREKLIPYLKKVGFNPKSDFIFIPCSGLTGAFIKDTIVPECPWYKGPAFIQYLDEMPPISRATDGPVRIPLVDKYNDMGTVVLGKVESGSVSKGQTLTLMPNRVSVQVLQLWSDDFETEEITSGENVKLKLKGVDEGDILPGFVLCSNDDVCHTGRLLDAQVVILEHKSIIAAGYRCVMHIHNAVEEVEVKAIGCLIDKKTGDKKKVKFVKQDQICIMKLESEEVFCLETFKAFPQMGRFTLRDEGKTIAIGKVLKVCE